MEIKSVLYTIYFQSSELYKYLCCNIDPTPSALNFGSADLSLPPGKLIMLMLLL